MIQQVTFVKEVEQSDGSTKWNTKQGLKLEDDTWATAFNDTFAEGDFVVIKTNGKYKNASRPSPSQIQGREQINQVAQAVTPAQPAPTSNMPKAAVDKDRLIVRQTCIKAASELAGVTNAQEVISIAKELESWVMG